MSLVWRMLDPLLLRLRARLEHLELHAPSKRAEAALRARGEVAKTAWLTATTEFDNRQRPEQLQVGDYSYIRGEISLLAPDARVTIGHHSYLGPQSRIMAQASVTIGNFVLIAHLVDIIDNNSHSLDWRERRQDAVLAFEERAAMRQVGVSAAAVTIDDDVWIGTKSTILKGVHIGRGAVIAAGSIVTSDVAPFTLVGGNPARVIKELPRGEEP